MQSRICGLKFVHWSSAHGLQSCGFGFQPWPLGSSMILLLCEIGVDVRVITVECCGQQAAQGSVQERVPRS